MSNRTPITHDPRSEAGTRTEVAKAPSKRECRARADAYVAELIGARSKAVTWDAIHPLQGHVHIGCHELVVIATHDALARPLVLTAAGWDAVRHCSADERRDVLASCAITDHGRLVSVLESDDTEWMVANLALAA